MSANRAQGPAGIGPEHQATTLPPAARTKRRRRLARPAAALADPSWADRLKAELLAHPHVADVALRWQSDVTGTQLKIFVLPRPRAPEGLQRSLRLWLRHHLPGAAIPRSIVLCRRLPADSMLDEVA